MKVSKLILIALFSLVCLSVSAQETEETVIDDQLDTEDGDLTQGEETELEDETEFDEEEFEDEEFDEEDFEEDQGVPTDDGETDGETPKTEGETRKTEGENPKTEGEKPKTEDDADTKTEGENPKTEGEKPKDEKTKPEEVKPEEVEPEVEQEVEPEEFESEVEPEELEVVEPEETTTLVPKEPKIKVEKVKEATDKPVSTESTSVISTVSSVSSVSKTPEQKSTAVVAPVSKPTTDKTVEPVTGKTPAKSSASVHGATGTNAPVKKDTNKVAAGSVKKVDDKKVAKKDVSSVISGQVAGQKGKKKPNLIQWYNTQVQRFPCWTYKVRKARIYFKKLGKNVTNNCLVKVYRVGASTVSLPCTRIYKKHHRVVIKFRNLHKARRAFGVCYLPRCINFTGRVVRFRPSLRIVDWKLDSCDSYKPRHCHPRHRRKPVCCPPRARCFCRRFVCICRPRAGPLFSCQPCGPQRPVGPVVKSTCVGSTGPFAKSAAGSFANAPFAKSACGIPSGAHAVSS